MSDNTKQLREQRANIWEQMKALTDLAERENRDFTAEEKATWAKAEADLDSLGDRVERAEKMAALDAKLAQPAGRPEGLFGDPVDEHDDDAYSEAFSRFVRRGMAQVSPEQQAALQQRFIQNAAAVGTGAAGGYTIPPAFRATMIETAKAFGVMLTESELVETETGANMPWPTNDDTGNVGAILAENQPITEQGVTFGQGSLDAYMFTSKLVRASIQFLQDSPNADTWLAKKLGERIGRIKSQLFTIGTGTNQPDGIVTSATIGVTGAGSLATTGGISYDNLVDLMESLDPAYGDHPDARWMMHQTIRKAIRKLKDNTGKPIWEPSVQVGVPDTLLGRAVRVNNDMASVAQNSVSLGFGNIKAAYVVREVIGSAALLRLTERYADNLQVGFIAFERADGTLQDANAFKTFKTTPTA